MLVGALLLVLAVWMTSEPLTMPQTSPPCAFATPILCAELPVSGAHHAQVFNLEDNDPGVWRRVIVLDFPFLVLYPTLLILGALALQRHRDEPAPRLIWWSVALSVIGAGALDAIENLAMLDALAMVEAGGAPTDGLAARATLAATLKFSSLGVAGLLYLVLLPGAAMSRQAMIAWAVSCLVAAVAIIGPVVSPAFEVGMLGVALLCTGAVLSAWYRLRIAERAALQR